LKVGLMGVDVAMVVRLPLTRASVSAWMGVYQREVWSASIDLGE